MAGKVAKFVVKSAVAGSLIYVTLRVTHGPWGTPHLITTFARPEGTNFMDHTPLPGNQESPDLFKEKWNKGVRKVFHGLHEAPGALAELSNKTVTELKEKYKNANK